MTEMSVSRRMGKAIMALTTQWKPHSSEKEVAVSTTQNKGEPWGQCWIKKISEEPTSSTIFYEVQNQAKFYLIL